MDYESLYFAGFFFVIVGGSMFSSGILSKNKKEIIAIVVVAVLATVCLLFAGCGKKEEVVETKPLTWNGLKFAKELPELKAKKIMVAANEETYLLANFEGVTLEGFNDYIAQCETKGFNVEPKKEEFTYQAYCAKGLELYMIYGNDSICLELKKVREFKDLTWPTEGLATLLPQCSATKGKIKTNTKKEFAVNVGGFSKDALSKYMDACVAKGFDQNVNRTEDLFEASNKKGYKVQLKYEGFSQVYIYIEAPIYKITLDCTCVENWIFSIYDLKIYVEGNLVGTLDHGHKEKYDISLVRGTYEIRIEKSDDSEIYETVEFNAVKDDTIKLKMSCHSSYVDVKVDTEVVDNISGESSEDKTDEEVAVEKTEEKILNSKNNKDLAYILSTKNEFDDRIGEFADEYYGCIIEFNGYVADVMPYKDYKTRFNYLICVGNYGKSPARGPQFQFRDVNRYDLKLSGDNIPNRVGEGMNIHVVAEVGEYDRNTGLFELDPVKITMR